MSEYLLVLYRSTAERPDFDPTDIDILRTALRFNRSHGITGYLWRAINQFFQVLHGPVAPVEALLQRIVHDDRHSKVEILLYELVADSAAFSGWSMGYDHFLENELCLALEVDGSRVPVDIGKAHDIVAAMRRAAEEARTYGSAFPFARQPGECEDQYLARLNGDQ